jgi:hypothetical protein
MLEAALENEMGVLALKALAKRQWHDDEPKESRRWTKTWYHPVESPEEAELGLRFTLSKPITAAVSPGHEELLWWMCDAADNLEPLTVEKEELLKARSQQLEPIFPQNYS